MLSIRFGYDCTHLRWQGKDWTQVKESIGRKRLPHYNIIEIPTLQSIIEAYPKWYGYDVILIIIMPIAVNLCNAWETSTKVSINE